MNPFEIMLIAMLLFFMGLHVASGLSMCYQMSRRGLRINIALLRLKIFTYINSYRIAKKQESGHSGYLYYSWIISANIALLAYIGLLIIDLIPVINEYMIVINDSWVMSVIAKVCIL